MLPLSDGLSARSFPVVNVALIAANFAVWILYELPDLEGAVGQSSFKEEPGVTAAAAPFTLISCSSIGLEIYISISCADRPGIIVTTPTIGLST